MRVSLDNLKTIQLPDALDTERRAFTRRCSGLAAVLLVQAPFARILAASGDGSRAAAQLNAFLDEFSTTAEEETSRDLSAGAFQRKRKMTSAKLQRLRAIDRNELQADDLLNYRFAESLLVGQMLAQERLLWSMDPRVYLPFACSLYGGRRPHCP